MYSRELDCNSGHAEGLLLSDVNTVEAIPERKKKANALKNLRERRELGVLV
jgi:hypothetical protein